MHKQLELTEADLETYTDVVNKFINSNLEVMAKNPVLFEQPALAN
jgi:hypothetical protein